MSEPSPHLHPVITCTSYQRLFGALEPLSYPGLENPTKISRIAAEAMHCLLHLVALGLSLLVTNLLKNLTMGETF